MEMGVDFDWSVRMQGLERRVGLDVQEIVDAVVHVVVHVIVAPGVVCQREAFPGP